MDAAVAELLEAELTQTSLRVAQTTACWIVAAAHRLDAAFWAMHIQIARGDLDADEAWQVASRQLQAARLDSSTQPAASLPLLVRPLGGLGGKPAPSDPIFQAPKHTDPEAMDPQGQ